jgi:hypothetical protein
MENQSENMQIQMRRLRVLSDMIEDYQDNMRRIIGLFGREMDAHQQQQTPVDEQEQYNTNMQNLLQLVLQQNTQRRTNTPQTPVYSFNRTPPIRREFSYYTQFTNPTVYGTDEESNTDSYIDLEQESRSLRISQQQIVDSATQVIRYDASMNQDRCPITWDNFQPGQNVIKINRCGHIFCINALKEWIQSRHNYCPVCRGVIISQPIDLSGNTRMTNRNTTVAGNTSSRAINQLISGILSGVNSAVNTNTGYYESELELNMNDFMELYRQFVNPTTFNVNLSAVNRDPEHDDSNSTV